jgi:Cu/Ag efflux protein CusF
LRNWDISEEQIKALAAGGEAKRSLSFRSPVGGVVLEKKALAGMRFMPGETLYKISNLSSLWLQAQVFEQDLSLVRPGQSAKITVSAYPGKAFSGKVAFVYPTVAADTRTAKVRIELANPGGELKPDMYATVELAAGRAKGKVLTVPRSAVLDTGTRQVVLIERGEGQFEPRTVKLGMYADEYVEVLDGVREGEKVVVSANFLIDAESNLKAALGAFGTSAGAETKPAAAPQASTPIGQAHKAQGTINSIDAQAGTVNINHAAIPSLNWPAMTMDFTVKDKSMLNGVRPGQKIDFDIVQQGPDRFIVTRIAPAGTPSGQASAPRHSGH